jgi:hypothetical protein
MLVKGSCPWSTVLLDGDIFPRQRALLAFLTSEYVGSCRQICEFNSFHMLEAHMRARKLIYATMVTLAVATIATSWLQRNVFENHPGHCKIRVARRGSTGVVMWIFPVMAPVGTVATCVTQFVVNEVALTPPKQLCSSESECDFAEGQPQRCVRLGPDDSRIGHRHGGVNRCSMGVRALS